MVVQLKSNFQESLPQAPKKSTSRMTKAECLRRKTLKALRDQTDNFEVINPNAAGIDVGSEQMFVAVPSDRDPGACWRLRFIHGRFAPFGRLAYPVQNHVGGDGIHRSLLDSFVPNPPNPGEFRSV